MKKTCMFVITLFLTFVLFLLNALSQDYAKRNLPKGVQASLGNGSGFINDIKFSPDGSRIVVASSSRIRIYDLITYKELNLLRGDTYHANSICFSPDGNTIASGSSGTVRLWSATTGKLLKTLTGHKSYVESLCFSPNGALIASGSSDDTVRLWSATTGKLLKTLTAHTANVESVCFSPDGKTIASGDWKGTVRLWSANTGKLLKTLISVKPDSKNRVLSVCFSPDGKTIASGSYNGTVCLWSAATGKLLKILTERKIPVTSVCFSPDGTIIASGSGSILIKEEDQIVRLWSANTGKLLKTLTGHAANVESVCFSPDGTILASGDWDGTIFLWDMHLIKSQIYQQMPMPIQQVMLPQTPQQIAKKALNSTVLIVMEDANDRPVTSGSGFFVGRGMIATNLHVVEGVFNGYIKRVGMDKTYRIKGIVAMNAQQDLAILKVSDIGAPILPLGNSDELEIGEPVYAVGNPKGYLEGTFTEGVVSGVREFQVDSKRIQMSAPVSEGSSGGPMLNSKGEVIGVAVSKLTEGQNLNFAIPSNYLKELLYKAGIQR